MTFLHQNVSTQQNAGAAFSQEVDEWHKMAGRRLLFHLTTFYYARWQTPKSSSKPNLQHSRGQSAACQKVSRAHSCREHGRSFLKVSRRVAPSECAVITEAARLGRGETRWCSAGFNSVAGSLLGVARCRASRAQLLLCRRFFSL